MSIPNDTRRERGRATLWGASLLLSANLCVFGPLEIISANRAEFDVTPGDVFPWLISACLALAALIVLAGRIFPKRIRPLIASIILSIGVLFWVQGSFLRWGYGVLDGTGIDWTDFPWQGWVDIGIWVTLLALTVRFGRRLSRHVLFISLALVFLQTGFVLARTMTGSNRVQSPPSGEVADVVPRALCQLSSTRNVFHIIMDSFQTDVFMELVEEDDLRESLDGFVVYRGNISTGARTILSVPAVFSTNVYAGTETESEYFRKAASGSFHYLLSEAGYVVNLMPHVSMNSTPGANYFRRSATYAAPHHMRVLRASTYLIDLSMFRQFPQWMKRVVYNDENWRLSSLVGDPPTHVSFHQKAFFRDYIHRLEVSYPEPAYHFLHLMPPHGPFVTNSDGSYAGHTLPHTRENYKHEARYVLRLFMDLLETLRDLGIYDSSMVLLHGDHGAGLTRRTDDSVMKKRMSKVSALLVLKAPAARGPLKSSSAQTSLTDIPATVMSALGIEHPYPGDSILELDPERDRTRRVAFVTDQSSREPIVHQWLVRGSADDSTSWRELRARKVERRIHSYDWGTRLRFGIANAGDAYLTSGWSTTSPSYTWSDGDSAEITLGIDPPDRDVRIEMVFFGYVAKGKWDRQRIRLSVNGWALDEIVCDHRGMRENHMTVPREVLQGERMVLSFEFPDAVVPREIGEGGESRALGMGLYSIQASLVPEGEPAGR